MGTDSWPPLLRADHDVQSPLELKSRCARVSRIIAKLRGHSLVAKVHGSRLYRATERAHRVIGLAIRFRLLDFPQTLAA